MSAGRAAAPRWVLPALIVLSLATAAILAVVLATTFVRVPLISNEGWSAIHARHALAGGNLYTPNGYGNFPNYPPLAFYPVAWLGALIGDMIATADGPVFCREPTWCYWAGRDNHIDYSNAGQKLSAGPEAVAAFQAWVAANPPVLMQLYDPEGGFIVRSMGAFASNYVEVMSTPMRIWVLKADR